MNKKLKVAEVFSAELNKRLPEFVYGIYLFGSVAKGVAHNESDIDILVIYPEDADYKKIAETVDDICFKLACEFGETPEVVLMSFAEYEDEVRSSPFLWEILNYGRPLVLKKRSTEWNLDFKDYIELAEEFLSYAMDAIKEKKLRLAIDTAYNSAELLCKSLIISTGNKLASSHGGVIGQFSQIFIMTGKLKSEIGRGLNRALRLRALARYRPKAKITLEDANFVLSLAEEILTFAKKELGV